MSFKADLIVCGVSLKPGMASLPPSLQIGAVELLLTLWLQDIWTQVQLLLTIWKSIIFGGSVLEQISSDSV